MGASVVVEMGTRRSLVAASLLSCLWVVAGLVTECQQPSESVYSFTAMNINKTMNISLSQYEGKVLVITNLATFWGLTPPHYYGFNALKSKFEGQPFEILGFPCNNFNLQEPGETGAEILNGIKYVRPGGGFVPNFMMFEKIDINGNKEHPLYTYLKKYCPPVGDEFEDQSMLYYTPLKNEDVRWNFEQFIINKSGKPVLRYSSDTMPMATADSIEKLLRM